LVEKGKLSEAGGKKRWEKAYSNPSKRSTCLIKMKQLNSPIEYTGKGTNVHSLVGQQSVLPIVEEKKAQDSWAADRNTKERQKRKRCREERENLANLKTGDGHKGHRKRIESKRAGKGYPGEDDCGLDQD